MNKELEKWEKVNKAQTRKQLADAVGEVFDADTYKDKSRLSWFKTIINSLRRSNVRQLPEDYGIQDRALGILVDENEARHTPAIPTTKKGQNRRK